MGSVGVTVGNGLDDSDEPSESGADEVEGALAGLRISMVGGFLSVG
jgi:hypothetical protein